MGNEASLCNVSRQGEPVPPTPTQTSQTQRPNVTGKPPIHSNKGADNFLPCDCCATSRGRDNQEQNARRGFEASLQTPKGKAQGFRNTDIGRQGKPAPNPSNEVPDIIVSHIAPRGSSIPPLDFSSDSGSVPPSTDVDGRWIERPADATTPREYAYDPV
mmetsp:Transcript_48852/g.101988  ORF Transcript_48852/g.101988 Transcript_48852/m.101988 type:complete len:159 (-) Transcript_48852:173-649(-)